MSPLEAIAYLTSDQPAIEGAADLDLDEDELPVLTPFSGGLVVSYALDCEDALELIQAGDLTDAGITREQLHTAAVENLARLAKGRLSLRRTDHCSALFLDGNFEASLLLLDALWDTNLRDCYQRPVIAVPSRDVLAFCDISSGAGIEELRALIARVWPGGEHLLSDKLFSRVDGRWAVYSDA
jgi:uncharacterized protein YtpQ (UPF0354 family)